MSFRGNLDLLGALVTRRHDAAAERVCAASFDAEGFERFLARHQLSGCLDALLAGSPARDLLPPRLLASLEAAHEEQRGRNRTLLAELKRVGAAFGAAGVPMIVLKGPYLADRFYGAVDRRRFWDLDVLVRRADLPAVRHVLASTGHIRDSRVLLGERLTAFFTHAFDYAGPHGRLDLHWALATHPSYRLDYGAVWRTAQPYTLDGCAVDVLSDEYEVVFGLLSCLRDIERGGLRVRSLVDLYMILDRVASALDWDAFFEARSRENIAPICRAALSFLLAALGAHDRQPALSAALRPASMTREDALALLEPSRYAWRAKRWSWGLHGMSAPGLVLWWAVSLPFRVTVHRTHRTRPAAPASREPAACRERAPEQGRC